MIYQFRWPERDVRLGRHLARARHEKDLTQAEMALRMGISHSLLSKLEIGARHWRLETIVVAAKVLGLTQEDPELNGLIAPPPATRRRRRKPDVDLSALVAAHGHGRTGRRSETEDLPVQRPASTPKGLDLSVLPKADGMLLTVLHEMMVERAGRLAA